MRQLLIFSLLIVVYGEAPADPGYAYPIPPNGDSSLLEETPIEEINRFIYFFKSPEQKKPPPPKPPVKPPQPKKNYKIIFIKAPDAPMPPVPPVPLPPRDEEKTIVYVLSKKPEELAEVVPPTPPSTKPPAPEVYFINYGLKKESGKNENGGYDYSSQSESTEAPASKPLVIPNEYLPPKESAILEARNQAAPEVPSAREISSKGTKKDSSSPAEDQYGHPNKSYNSQEATKTVQTSFYSPFNVLPNGAQRDSLKVSPSFASEVASQYGPPQKGDVPPPPPLQPPEATYGVPDVAFSLSSKASSNIDEFGRYLPPSTSYGLPDPGIRLSRSSGYSPPRRARKVYQELDPSLDIIKGVYEYYGP